MPDRDPHPRTTCPECGRDVAFTTDLEHKFLRPHDRPSGVPCVKRTVPVPA